MEKFRTFTVLFGVERGQKAQEISFVSSPRFVRSHAINLHTWKVFLSPNEVKLTWNVTWVPYRRSPGKFADWREKNSSSEFFHRHRRTVRSLYPRGRILASKFLPLVFQLLLWPMFIFIAKKFQTKLSQDAPRAKQHPRVNFGLNINWHENENFFLISVEKIS